MNESWKDIVGYEGLYQVSNLARVKSLERLVKRDDGFLKVNERILSPTKSTGYYRVHLSKSNRMKCFLIHRLVAQAFIKTIIGKEFINHKNGIKTDNRLENLEWVNKSENAKHAYDNDLQKAKTGADNGNSILNVDDVNEIKYSNINLSSRKIAKKYSISKSTVLAIRSNKTWKHI